MSNHPTIAIDGGRLSQMLGTLQRAGLYPACKCNGKLGGCGPGCTNCSEAARRLLARVAQSGRFAGVYRPQQLGARFRVYSRPLGGRVVNVLTDVSENPKVVGVSVEPTHLVETHTEGITDEEVSLGALLEKRLPAATSQTLRQTVRNYAPKEAPLFALVRSIEKVPRKPGLYVLQWSGGQYLGKADDLRKRLVEHQGSMRRYGLNPFHFQMYVATTTSSPRALEHKILTSLAAKVGGAGNFKRLGMTNRQTELEMEFETF